MILSLRRDATPPPAGKGMGGTAADWMEGVGGRNDSGEARRPSRIVASTKSYGDEMVVLSPLAETV